MSGAIRAFHFETFEAAQDRMDVLKTMCHEPFRAYKFDGNQIAFDRSWPHFSLISTHFILFLSLFQSRHAAFHRGSGPSRSSLGGLTSDSVLLGNRKLLKGVQVETVPI